MELTDRWGCGDEGAAAPPYVEKLLVRDLRAVIVAGHPSVERSQLAWRKLS